MTKGKSELTLKPFQSYNSIKSQNKRDSNTTSKKGRNKDISLLSCCHLSQITNTVYRIKSVSG
jgi:hypothetical protein